MSFRSLNKVVALAVYFAVPAAGCATGQRVRIVESCIPDPESQSLLCYDPEGLYYEVPYSALNTKGQSKIYGCTLSGDLQFLIEEYRKK